MPRVWRIDSEPTSIQLDEIADVLSDGGVLLLPTDTIYGLHAVAANEEAVERIAAIKGREETKPFIVLASSAGDLSSLGVATSDGTLEALATIWPAPLTAILPLRQPVPASRGASSLAVRVPAVPWLRELVRRTGPLVSTSANRSGEPAIESPELLAPDLQNRLDGVVDQGVRNGAPSAIVDLASGEPRLVREGEFSFTQKVWKTLRKTL